MYASAVCSGKITPGGKKGSRKKAMGVFSFVKAGKKIYGTIKSVKPALGKSKLKKAVDDVKLSSLKAKGKMKRSFQKMEEDIDPARKKLRQTTQKLKGEKVTESGVSKGKDLRENKMGGGMMGRRFGMKKGSKFPDLTGDGKVTFADILKGRGVINGKKKKKA